MIKEQKEETRKQRQERIDKKKKEVKRAFGWTDEEFEYYLNDMKTFFTNQMKNRRKNENVSFGN